METTPDIMVAGTFKDYYNLLNIRLECLQKLLQDFKSKRLAMINKDWAFFWYNSSDLAYVISPLMTQLHTTSRKVIMKYVGPVVIYKMRKLPSQVKGLSHRTPGLQKTWSDKYEPSE